MSDLGSASPPTPKDASPAPPGPPLPSLKPAGTPPPAPSIFIPPTRRSRWSRPGFRWGAIGVAGLVVLASLGVAFWILPRDVATTYLEVWVSDAPAPFDQLLVGMTGVFVGDEGYALRMEASGRSFDLLKHHGTENPLKVAAGEFPEGHPTKVSLVFKDARGVVATVATTLSVPKKMLTVSTGTDLGQSAQGAVLLDFDVAKSVAPCDGKVCFQPFVEKVYYYDFVKGRPSGTPPGAKPELPAGGFGDQPPLLNPPQRLEDPPVRFQPPPANPPNTRCQTNCGNGNNPGGGSNNSSNQTNQGPQIVPELGSTQCFAEEETCAAVADMFPDEWEVITALYGNVVRDINVVIHMANDHSANPTTPPTPPDPLALAGTLTPPGHLPLNPDTNSALTAAQIQLGEELIVAHGGVVLFHYTMSPAIAAYMNPIQAYLLSKVPGIQSVEAADAAISWDSFPSAKDAVAWNALQVAAGGAPPNNLAYTGAGVGVAIVDSGLDCTHPDLPYALAGTAGAVCLGNYKIESIAQSEIAKTPVGSAVSMPITDATFGHGTHVAGIIASQAAGDQKGLAPGVKIYGYAMADANTLLWATQAMDLILYQTRPNNPQPLNPPIRIVQNSWSSTDTTGLLASQLRSLVDRGITVVFSAGNSGGDGSEAKTSRQCWDPYPGIICVGGYDDRGTGSPTAGEVWTGSSRGKASDPATWTDLLAPSKDIFSTKPPSGTVGTGVTGLPSTAGPIGVPSVSTPTVTNSLAQYYGPMTGTSVAAPMVSACVALMLQANPALAPAQIQMLLELTAVRFYDPATAKDFARGSGNLDCKAAVESSG